jgi:hypothetical protein
MNIESLAQNLGLDPSQFNDDLDGLRSRFQEHYNDMIDAANQDDKSKPFALATDGNNRANNGFMHTKEDGVPQAANLNPRSATTRTMIPTSSSVRLQQQQQPSIYQLHPLSPSLVQPMQQQQVKNNKNTITRQFNLLKSIFVYKKQQLPSQLPTRSTTYPMMDENEKHTTGASNNADASSYRPPYPLPMNYSDSFASNYSSGDRGEREYSVSQRGNIPSFNLPQANNNTRKGYIDCYQNSGSKDNLPDQTNLTMPAQVPIDMTRQHNYAHIPTQVAYSELAQQQTFSQFNEGDNNFS